MKATVEQWKSYLMVQYRGNWNMLDKHAIVESGLSEDIYYDILWNYDGYAMCESGYKQALKEVREYFDEIANEVEDNYNETHCYSY